MTVSVKFSDGSGVRIEGCTFDGIPQGYGANAKGRDRDFFEILHKSISMLLNPASETSIVRDNFKGLDPAFGIIGRTQVAMAEALASGQLKSRDTKFVDVYRRNMMFEGFQDPVLNAYTIVEQAFLKNSKRMIGMPQGDRACQDAASKMEKQWQPKRPQNRIIPLLRNMERCGLASAFQEFVKSDDCALPHSVKSKIAFGFKQLRQEKEREIRKRRFEVVETDGMKPSAEAESDVEVQTFEAEHYTSHGTARGLSKRPKIENMFVSKVRERLLKDPNLKSDPMVEFQTEAMPAPKRGTPRDEIDERQTYSYRSREATYTWFHVERTDGQWVNIGVSSDDNYPVYVCMHEAAIDLKGQRVVASVDSLRANGYTQILKKTDTLLDRLQEAIHTNKDRIEPVIHERFNWLRTPNAGFALLNSVRAFNERTGQNPHTNSGVIRDGNETIDPVDGSYTSMNGRTDYNAARAALARGSVIGFEHVKNLAEFNAIADHVREHNRMPVNIPVLNPKAREKVHAANQNSAHRPQLA